MKSFKDKISGNVKDIIYQKAKEEVRFRINNKIDSVKSKVRSFLGLGESRKQRLKRIADEYRNSNDLISKDTLAGITELFTLNYALTATYFSKNILTDKPENH